MRLEIAQQVIERAAPARNQVRDHQLGKHAHAEADRASRVGQVGVTAVAGLIAHRIELQAIRVVAGLRQVGVTARRTQTCPGVERCDSDRSTDSGVDQPPDNAATWRAGRLNPEFGSSRGLTSASLFAIRSVCAIVGLGNRVVIQRSPAQILSSRRPA